MGTLMRKIHDQPGPSASAPPMIGPSSIAEPKTRPVNPAYLPRSRGLNRSPIAARPNVIKPPAPSPWAARSRMSASMFGASEQATEPIRKMPTAVMRSRRRPKASENFPHTGVDSVAVIR